MAVIFIDGFDKYTTINEMFSSAEWTAKSIVGASDFKNFFLTPGLIGPGNAVRLEGSSGEQARFWKTLSTTYARLIGGFHIKPQLNHVVDITAVVFNDTVAGGDQVSIVITGTGDLRLRRGDPISGTTLAIATGVFSNNTVHCVEFDITFDNSAGAFTVDVDGVTKLSETSQDTTTTANNNANQINLMVRGGGGSAQTEAEFDNLYLLDNTGSAPLNAILGQPIVETTFPTSDVQKQHTLGQGYLGEPFTDGGTGGAGGANDLYLRPFTAIVGGNVQSVTLGPAVTEPGAKFKAAIYADNGSGTAPSGAPLASGTEVIGSSLGANLVLPLSSPLAITGGTIYWIGYIGDTEVLIFTTDDDADGFSANATYTSGVPNPAPSMSSGITSREIWADVTGISTNYSQVNHDPSGLDTDTLEEMSDNGGASQLLGDLSYLHTSVVGNEDLYGHNPLVSVPVTIFTACVKSLIRKDDAGARTVDLRVKSSAALSSGSNAGQSPAQSYTYLWSFYDLDPNTAAAWTKVNLDAASKGQKVAS